MTAHAIDLKKMSDETLQALYDYWNARLNARGGSWLVLVMQVAAEEMIAELNAEIQSRKPVEQESAQS